MSTVSRRLARTISTVPPRTLAAIGLVVTAAAGLSLRAPGHPEVMPTAWVVVACSAAAFLGAATDVGRRLWLRVGTVLFAALIAVLVATTGGPDSAYQDLFVILLVASAVIKRPLPLTVDGVAVVLAALAPVLYGPADPAYVSDLVIDVGTWLVVAITARLLALGFAGATTNLAESDRRFELLANDVPGIVYRVSLDGRPRLSWVSRQARAITGYPAEAFVEDPDLVLRRVPPEDMPDFMRSRQRATRAQTAPARYRFERPDGERIWLEDHYAPLTDEHGRPVAGLGVVFDVSAQVAAEQAQQAAHEHERLARLELGRVLAAQRTFIQGISHEFRTPLTTVAGFARLLADRRDELSPDQLDEYTQRLLSGTVRLTRLVDDLVDIERLVGDLDSGVTTTAADLRTLVEEAVRHVPADQHQVRVVGDPGIGEVDATVLHRIARHLVDNACRHTPPGTHVTCTIAREDDHVRLVVEDDGPGIPEELAPTLFEPFVQGAHAPTDPNPGTGIGLALVAHLARAHGGAIWHETVWGCGARFVVVLRQPD